MFQTTPKFSTHLMLSTTINFKVVHLFPGRNFLTLIVESSNFVFCAFYWVLCLRHIIERRCWHWRYYDRARPFGSGRRPSLVRVFDDSDDDIDTDLFKCRDTRRPTTTTVRSGIHDELRVIRAVQLIAAWCWIKVGYPEKCSEVGSPTVIFFFSRSRLVE